MYFCKINFQATTTKQSEFKKLRNYVPDLWALLCTLRFRTSPQGIDVLGLLWHLIRCSTLSKVSNSVGSVILTRASAYKLLLKPLEAQSVLISLGKIIVDFDLEWGEWPWTLGLNYVCLFLKETRSSVLYHALCSSGKKMQLGRGKFIL